MGIRGQVMKLTKQQLKQIIREELEGLLEVGGGTGRGGGSITPPVKNPQKEKQDRCSQLSRKKSKGEEFSEEDQKFFHENCRGTGPTGRNQ